MISVPLLSCATTHDGPTATAGHGSLTASCVENESMTTGTIHVLSCTFENTSEDHWVNVQVRETTVFGERVKATVLSAADVDAFTSALLYKKKKDQHNQEIALNSVALGGLGVAVTNNTSSLAKTGG